MTTVTALILTNDQPEKLGRCLNALREAEKQLGEAKLEAVIVLDLGIRKSDTQDAMRSSGLQQLFWSPCEQWFNRARAVNYGALQAKSDLLLLLSDDTRLASGALRTMVDAIPDKGVVGPLLLFPDSTILAAGIELTKRTAASFVGHLLDLTRYDWVRPRVDTMAVPFYCALVTRELFCQLGGLDEDFQGGIEDVDFCLRAREQRASVTLLNDAHCVCEGDSTNDMVPRVSMVNTRVHAFQPLALRWLLGDKPRIDAVWGGGSDAGEGSVKPD